MTEREIFEKQLKNLFAGIIAGDGDILGRMASSHAGAEPAYGEPIGSLVRELSDRFDAGEFDDFSRDEVSAEADNYVERSRELGIFDSIEQEK